MHDYTITAEDEARFRARQSRIPGREWMFQDPPKETLRGNESDGPQNIMDAIMGMFGEPRTVTVGKLEIRIDSPTVDGLLAFISAVQEIDRKRPEDAEQAVLGKVRALMLDSLEFPENGPEDPNAWLGKLRTREAAALMAGFAEVFDFRAMMGHVGDLRGKAEALRGRASPGKS